MLKLITKSFIKSESKRGLHHDRTQTWINVFNRFSSWNAFYLLCGSVVMIKEKLWAVNIPEEPDSELFHPVPTQKIGKQLVYRLKKEALQTFPTVGQCIADAITLEEWKGTQEDHAKYLQENKEWWHDTTFLEQAND